MNADIFFGYGLDEIANEAGYDFDPDGFMETEITTLERLSRFWLETKATELYQYRLPDSRHLMPIAGVSFNVQFPDYYTVPISLGSVLFSTQIYKCLICSHPEHGVSVLLATAIHWSLLPSLLQQQ